MGNKEMEAQSLKNLRRCVKWLAERERFQAGQSSFKEAPLPGLHKAVDKKAHREHRNSFAESCSPGSELAGSALDRKRAADNHMMSSPWTTSKVTDSTPNVIQGDEYENCSGKPRLAHRESVANSGSRPVGGRKGRADGAGGLLGAEGEGEVAERPSQLSITHSLYFPHSLY
jgi:hypothetical protein